jgi:hypothetical protein
MLSAAATQVAAESKHPYRLLVSFAGENSLTSRPQVEMLGIKGRLSEQPHESPRRQVRH